MFISTGKNEERENVLISVIPEIMTLNHYSIYLDVLTFKNEVQNC
jgi:hypothetical protein